MSLTDQQKRFIKFYVQSGNGRRSAILAGYSEKNAGKAARNLLYETPAVMAEIQKAKDKKNAPSDTYDLAAAMKEADEAIEIARATDNAASFLAAVKLKSQLMKILDDRPQGSNFQVVISGIGSGDGEKTVINVTQAQPSVNLLTGDGDAER